MCLITGIVKTVVFVFNFIFSIVGIILIAVGSWAYVEINDNADAIKGNYTYATAFVIAVGVFVFLVSFLGCCGVCQSSKCMLNTYAVILLILFILQIAAGAIGYSLVSDEDNFKKELTDGMYEVFNHKSNETLATFVNLQEALECCGVKGKGDYNNMDLPASCCKGEFPNHICTNPTMAYNGCADKLADVISNSNQIVAYVALGIAAVELAGAIFGCLLARTM